MSRSAPQQTAPPRRNLREEQKSLTHRRLLEAAVTVFDELSFLDARMEDIARAAGVTRATVYAHFTGKAQIVDALVERVYELREEAYAELAALPRWTPAGIRAWLDGAESRWREMAPIRRVANAAAPTALRSINDGRAQYVEAHERYVGLLISDPERWRGVDPAEARQRALMAVLQTESFFSAWIAVGLPVDTADPLHLLADSLGHLLGPALADA
ncbi:TetR/AcrR family transcriptional regulator [Streptomyces cylindrosporus]|uniref:TetR family transcriptional regulator n=1 Tax=Streptomyces cylindrosporus TaxID=2927583 RepID=A0ABS9YDI5_9ACTN|nr:TetR family transcriptional regulator [Streptomyces cylindrosporus]MCI3275299.1 TetR family transcriptional regulator [Streptomyces cylindrosporus]